MRILIRNVSHKSRRAPLSTVNFATKPRSPVGATAGTVSSGGIVALMPTASAYRLQNVREKLPRVEWREVIELLASADKTRWNSKFILNRIHDPTFAAAIEFSDDQTAEFKRAMEFARLTESIAARGRINYEQCLVRGVRIEFPQSAFYFLQLGHEVRFGVLATSCIAKQA